MISQEPSPTTTTTTPCGSVRIISIINSPGSLPLLSHPGKICPWTIRVADRPTDRRRVLGESGSQVSRSRRMRGKTAAAARLQKMSGTSRLRSFPPTHNFLPRPLLRLPLFSSSRSLCSQLKVVKIVCNYFQSSSRFCFGFLVCACLG